MSTSCAIPIVRILSAWNAHSVELPRERFMRVTGAAAVVVMFVVAACSSSPSQASDEYIELEERLASASDEYTELATFS